MNDITPYAGRWEAWIGEQLVGVGHTVEEVLGSVQELTAKENPLLVYVEPEGGEPLPLSPILGRLKSLLKRKMPVYLVGGAVRDALLGRISHDLDFVVSRDAIRLSFEIGNKMHEPAYALDRERDTGRVVLADEETMLDFACFRGSDLEADLRGRDFTINAMAIPATAQTRAAIIDPTGGIQDLDSGIIRLIEDQALVNDPVRTLRAVRLAGSLDFKITQETKDAVIKAGPLLKHISSERKRDEILKIVMTPHPDKAMRDLDDLGLLAITLPEVAGLSGISQSPPHHEDVLSHTWSVLNWLTQLEAALFGHGNGDAALESARAVLGEFVEQLREYLARPVDGGLDGWVILRLAGLFHDVGKQDKRTIDDDGRIRFFGHDEKGAELTGMRLKKLSLSRDAVNQVKRIVGGHMRPLSLVQAQGLHPSRRAVYRYFRALDHNGLDVALMGLADHLATYKGPGDQESWESLLGLAAQLFQFYFNQHEEAVKPPPLLSGRDMIELLGLKPGPEIGRVLRLIEEGQAAGEISTREEALRFAQDQIS